MAFQLYLLRRIMFTIPLLLGITVAAFFIANAIPADPINANLPQNALNNEEMVAAFRAKWGLDKPLHEQYVTYLGNLLQGDMGTSIKTRQPIAEDIRKFLPATIELAVTAILISVPLGIFLGAISAIWRNKIIDYVVRTFALVGVSFPVYLLALIALSLFHARWGLVAGPGRIDFAMEPPPDVTGFFTIDSILAGDWSTLRNVVSHMLLPSIVLASYPLGIIARVTRSSLLEVLAQDYMRTARAKGLPEFAVIFRHGLSNALIPVITIIGLSFGNLLAGSILIESIYAWPGLGRYAFRASTSQDFPAIMGVSLVIAFIYVGVNFLVDILYYFFDPRIRET
ncbi:MAG: ABC transporter permease [Chloroflexi bacterium]|nr:ABC transporter permease [Chloroflexota bacterium]